MLIFSFVGYFRFIKGLYKINQKLTRIQFLPCFLIIENNIFFLSVVCFIVFSYCSFIIFLPSIHTFFMFDSTNRGVSIPFVNKANTIPTVYPFTIPSVGIPFKFSYLPISATLLTNLFHY